MFVSRHVIFDEGSFPFTKTQNVPTKTTLSMVHQRSSVTLISKVSNGSSTNVAASSGFGGVLMAESSVDRSPNTAKFTSSAHLLVLGVVNRCLGIHIQVFVTTLDLFLILQAKLKLNLLLFSLPQGHQSILILCRPGLNMGFSNQRSTLQFLLRGNLCQLRKPS